MISSHEELIAELERTFAAETRRWKNESPTAEHCREAAHRIVAVFREALSQTSPEMIIAALDEVAGPDRYPPSTNLARAFNRALHKSPLYK